MAISTSSSRTEASGSNGIANRVFGQMGSFTSNTCNNGGVTASSLCNPVEMATDAAGRLYIADQINHRVLEYDNPLTSSVPNRVFGQGGSFTSNGCNTGGVSASSLCEPVGVALDSLGHLYIADRLNNRVLEFDNPLTSQVADRVFGQGGSFTANIPNNGGVSASSLCATAGIALDSSDRLYIVDSSCGHRVLEFDSPLTSQVADRVFGQGGSFTSNTCNNGGLSASSLCYPFDVAIDSAGRLYISERLNNRVLEFDSPLTSQVADRVFGQGGSFTSDTCNNGGITASSLCTPSGLAVDSADGLFLADAGNNRVLEYATPLTSQAAIGAFGQSGNFTSNTCNSGGTTASSLCDPYFVFLDAGDNVYIGDRGNNRVLEYDVDSDGDGCPNARELVTGSGAQNSGGNRDPLNPNDYFNPTHDGVNRVDDILLVVNQYFDDDSDGNPGLPPYAPGYNPGTDRTLAGPNAWNLGPPNGQQRIDDVLNIVNQYFHDCS